MIALGFVFYGIGTRDIKININQVYLNLPITNIQIILGRVLSYSLMIFTILSLFPFSYLLLAFVCETYFPKSGLITPELSSIFGWLVFDAFAYSVFFVGILLLATHYIKNSLLSALLYTGVSSSIFFIQSRFDYPNYVFIGGTFFSDYLPSKMGNLHDYLPIFLHRFGLLIFTLIIMISLSNQLERTYRGRNTYKWTIVSFWVLFIAFSYGSYQLHQNVISDRESYSTTHSSLEGVTHSDVISISGNVDIVPGYEIALDLALDIRIPTEEPQLHFTLNPGYYIEQLTLDGEHVSYEFVDGLISIELEKSYSTKDLHVVELFAKGRPLNNFSFIQSDIVSTYPVKTYKTNMRMLGNEPSIFTKDYVALLPTIAWYPTSGPYQNSVLTTKGSGDLFSMSISVSVPNGWAVAFPGNKTTKTEDGRTFYTFESYTPLRRASIFASSFKRIASNIHGIEYELLVSESTYKSIKSEPNFQEYLFDEFSSLMQTGLEYGLDYKFGVFYTVEVPINLYTYEQNGLMKSNFVNPGITLFREGALSGLNYIGISDDTLDDLEANGLADLDKTRHQIGTYFRNDIYGSSLAQSFVRNLVFYHIQVEGEDSQFTWFLFDELLRRIFELSSNVPSGHILLQNDTYQLISTGLRNIVAGSISSSIPDLLFEVFINRPIVWDKLSNQVTLDNPKNVNSLSIEVYAEYLLAKIVSELLIDKCETGPIYYILSELQYLNKSNELTSEEFFNLAQRRCPELDDVIELLNNRDKLPGYQVTNATSVLYVDPDDNDIYYETAFLIENSETLNGFFKAHYLTSNRMSIDGNGNEETKPVNIPGNSSLEISLITSTPIIKLAIYPYLSQNRDPISVFINPKNNPEPHVKKPAP